MLVSRWSADGFCEMYVYNGRMKSVRKTNTGYIVVLSHQAPTFYSCANEKPLYLHVTEIKQGTGKRLYPWASEYHQMK